MSLKKPSSILFFAVSLLILAGGIVAFVVIGGRENEQLRFKEQSTPVIIDNPAYARLTLCRSGIDLTDTTSMVLDDQPVWLRPGRYFIKADIGNQALFYPINLQSFRSGPDEDGSFRITVRRLVDESPPALDDSLPVWKYIPSGNFLLGDRTNPLEPHHVWLTGFFISAFEATNGEFRAFLEDRSGYTNDEWWTEEGRVWRNQTQSATTATIPRSHKDWPRFGLDDQPVLRVSWFEARAFTRWMTATKGDGKWLFALPNEAEWEMAARGPDGFDYGLSQRISDAEGSLYCWRHNPDAPHPVAGVEESKVRFRPNRYGLYHMTGNALEWSASLYLPFSKEKPFVDDDRNLPGKSGQRVARGGSWYSASIAYLGIAYRDAFQPEHRSQELGFRLVARRLP